MQLYMFAVARRCILEQKSIGNPRSQRHLVRWVDVVPRAEAKRWYQRAPEISFRSKELADTNVAEGISAGAVAGVELRQLDNKDIKVRLPERLAPALNQCFQLYCVALRRVTCISIGFPLIP